MFCFQCEQTAKQTGCTSFGVCGKDPETAVLQDLVVHVCKGLSQIAHKARQYGIVDHDADVYILEGLFTTVTNVNFDQETIAPLVQKGVAIRESLKARLEDAAEKLNNPKPAFNGPSSYQPAKEIDDLVRQGEAINLLNRREELGEDVVGLQELALYGLKGMAAYADHAMVLGVEDDAIYAFFHEALTYLANKPTDINDLTAFVLRVGEKNLRVMEMLDEANTGAYGHPEPTKIRVTPVKGKAILVSGHDLKDLKLLLEQTEGKGVNVYTHGEMLPALAYPELKKYPHLVGNYGGAWQDQRKEFDAFPGAILMTTNCIQKPKNSYKGRIFTSGLVQWPDVEHINDGNFNPVIEAALEAGGFEEDAEPAYTMTGFGHNAVMGVADKVVEAVKSGDIRHFFLIGGCDGAKSGRNYYTEMAEATPDDTVIMTLACGKFRFNKMDFGEVAGLPRMLDMGQCNDAYSAIKVAGALSEAFGVDVNELPLSLVLSWYEQKAVCILLTLLHLGMTNIRLGPTLPAFVTPAIGKVLNETFGLQPIGEVEDDLQTMLRAPA
ncbi:hydroxylamine reductase [bacterium]|nr:hydroxylamine reductase [bacterium]